ncbi:hypothetical protein [Azospirillum sp. SYSU D00513]|uniref:hypothetical protein n=1 Tax=Azospirillum sp. SYSU D00513 TaxID=2812561 RepID=UPI001A977D93|nr:hypothetical protein [Azospirillum sp. SYSU D00513]
MKEGVYTSPGSGSHSATHSGTSVTGTTHLASGGVEVHPGVHRRVSWSAVFAGVVLTLAIQLLLSMLGVGVGMTTIDPAAGANGLPEPTSFSMGAGIWWTVSYMIALAVGGYVAARLAGVSLRGDGMIHGLLTWAFALLVSAYLVTTAVGGIMGGAFSALGNVTSGLTQTVQQAAPEIARSAGVSPDDLRRQAEDLLRPADQQASPEDARSRLVSALTTMATGSGQQVDAARQEATSLIAQQAGIPEDQARQRLQQVEQQVSQTTQQATETATQAAETTSNALSAAGIGGTISLLLGAIAALIGGRIGTRTRDDRVVVS